MNPVQPNQGQWNTGMIIDMPPQGLHQDLPHQAPPYPLENHILPEYPPQLPPLTSGLPSYQAQDDDPPPPYPGPPLDTTDNDTNKRDFERQPAYNPNA